MSLSTSQEIRIILQLEQDVCSVTRCPAGSSRISRFQESKKKCPVIIQRQHPEELASVSAEISLVELKPVQVPRSDEKPHMPFLSVASFLTNHDRTKQSLTYGTPELVAQNS